MRQLGRRTIELFALVLVGSVLIWGLIYALPGDTAIAVAGEEASPAELEAVRIDLGLDDPISVQYLRWIKAAASGDLGKSYVTNEPVWDQIMRRLGPSAYLSVVALAIAIVLAVPASVIGTWRPRTAGRAVDMLFSLALAVPSFWIGILLVLLLAVQLRVLPSVSFYVPFWDDPGRSLVNIILPAFSLGVFAAGIFGRFLRSSLAENMAMDYIRAAKARGMGDFAVIIVHALRNSLLPLITVFALRAGALFSGSTVIEAVFNYPGLGRLILQAVNTRDYVLIQGSLLVVLVIFAVINLATDALYLLADPRARRSPARR